mgnify:CR=1 FL=1
MGKLVTNPTGSKTTYTYVADNGRSYDTNNPNFRPSSEGYVYKPLTQQQFDAMSPTEKTKVLETMEKGGNALGTYEKPGTPVETGVITVGEGKEAKSMQASKALIEKVQQDKTDISAYKTPSGETIYTTQPEAAQGSVNRYFQRVPVLRNKKVTSTNIETKEINTGLPFQFGNNLQPGQISIPTRIVKKEGTQLTQVSRGGRPLTRQVEISEAQYNELLKRDTEKAESRRLTVTNVLNTLEPESVAGKAVFATSLLSPQVFDELANLANLRAARSAGQLLKVTNTEGAVNKALTAISTSKTGTIIEAADATLSRTLVGRTAVGAATKIGTYEAVKGGTIVVSEVTKPAELRQISSADMNKALNQVYAAGSQSAEQKGVVQSFVYNINPMFADIASKNAGTNAGVEFLISRGYSPTLARRAVSRETGFRNAGQFIGDLSVSAISEVRGGRSVERYGLTSASLAAVEDNKRARFVAGKVFLPIALEGFTEGAAAEYGRQTFQQDTRAVDKRLKDIALMGAGGFVSAGLIGTVVAAAPYAKGTVKLTGGQLSQKRAGQLVEMGGYIIDPYEYAGDKIAQVSEYGANRAKNIKIKIPTNTLTNTLVKTNSQTNTQTSTKTQKATTQTATNAFTNIYTDINNNVPSNINTDIMTSLNTNVPVNIPTDTNTNTNTNTNTFTDVLTGTPTLTPLYRLPAPLMLPGIPSFGGSGGKGKGGRSGRRYVDELSAATSFFRAQLGGTETQLLKPSTRSRSKASKAEKKANATNRKATRKANSLLGRLLR